jgi:ribonuclease R
VARRPPRDDRSHVDPPAFGTGAHKREAGDFRPSRDDLLSYIEQNPDAAGKRELARAFGLKGADRVWLRDLLAGLRDEGLLEAAGRRHRKAGALPPVGMLDIYARDGGGTLLARPAEREGAAATAVVAIRMPRPGRGPIPGVGDRVLAKIFRSHEEDGGPTYTARVIKVFEKRPGAALGVVRLRPDGTARVDPVERGKPEFELAAEATNGARHGDLVEIEVGRSTRYGLPQARVLSVVGSLSSEKAVSLIAIHAHGIPNRFPQDVLAEAEAVTPAGMQGREDWRDLPLVTIDPADAKDHDDAVMGAPDDDPANAGGYVATVAIADIAAYVRPGTPLDREALNRGNSVYFPDRVVPMLPERISNDLCSLREGEDRPALAVRMVFCADGRKLRHSFHRVMMKSAARLSYPQAQAAIDGAADGRTAPLLQTVLRPLWAAYEVLKRGRDRRQPLDLDLPERKIVLKPDGTVDRVIVPERLDAHRLIEEFMIQANVAAAETLEAKKQALIYRVHDKPSPVKQDSLREFLASLGISLARGAELKTPQFNSILERVRGTEHEALVNEVVLRTQSQAVYSPENLGHFGLNLRRYAHFTSPIRRFADLIVHRALIAALGFGKDGLTEAQEARLEEIADAISMTERRAMAAERETVDRLIAAHLAERIGDEFSARISGVAKAGLFVQLPQLGADGFVPVSSLGDDYYMFDEVGRSLIGEKSGKGYRLADTVDVKLIEVAPMAGALRFEMLSEPSPLPGGRRSFHKAKARRDTRKGRPAPRRRR